MAWADGMWIATAFVVAAAAERAAAEGREPAADQAAAEKIAEFDFGDAAGADPVAGFDFAPGFEAEDDDRERFAGKDFEIEAVHPFGTLDEFGFTESNAPLNEIAGQRRRAERGILGDALHQLKNGILGR